MLLVVMLFGMAAALLVYGMVDTTSLAAQRDIRTQAALAQAKDALIGRAVSDSNRPGSLPCPDFDDGTLNPLNAPNDGIADVMFGNDCPSYIGRLPWKTLGLPDLRDSDGERLWYALSNNFRDDDSAQPINSDTKGNRTVNHGSTAVVFTLEAAAVIFAPGASLAAQIRDTVPALCPTNPAIVTPFARNLCAANYLDAAGVGANNAAAGEAGPFVSAQRSDTFNDRLLVITTAELMTPVEQRAVREIRTLLESYKTASSDGVGPLCDCYPWADNNFDGKSDLGATRGGPPLHRESDPLQPDALPHKWDELAVGVPGWLKNNDWYKVIYYAVAPAETASHSPATTLTVDVVSKNVVLITPGPAVTGDGRPSMNWCNYVSDALNCDSNDTFFTPSSIAYVRDRLATIP